MVDCNLQFIMDIVTIVILVIMAIGACGYHWHSGTSFSDAMVGLFLLISCILMILAPFLAPISSFFGFMTHAIGRPIYLLIISCFFFSGIHWPGGFASFCNAAAWIGVIYSVVLLVMNYEGLKAAAAGGASTAKTSV